MIKYLLFSALILVSQLAFSYTLEITEADIQEKVSAIMPIEKTKFFVKVKLSNPQVDLLKTGNRMAIHLNVETSIPNVVKGSGRGKVSGNLSYEASEGAFYFKDAKLESMEIDGLPQKYADKVTKIAEAIISKALGKYPVYKFTDKDVKQKIAKSTLESIEVRDEVLMVTLSLF